MTEHRLKCWPEYLELIRSGRKTFEVRDNADRTFREGDTVVLVGWNPAVQEFTGDERVYRRIGYVLPPGSWGLPASKTVFSLLEARNEQ